MLALRIPNSPPPKNASSPPSATAPTSVTAPPTRLSPFQHVSLAGSALVHANEVIHAAFFRLEETEQPERMAPYRHRRRHLGE